MEGIRIVFIVECGVISRRCNPIFFEHVSYDLCFFDAHITTHQSNMGGTLRKGAKKHMCNLPNFNLNTRCCHDKLSTINFVYGNSSTEKTWVTCVVILIDSRFGID
jgi:hypothetical protein